MNATDPELDRTSLRALLVAGSEDLPPDIDLLRAVRDRFSASRRRSRRRMRALVPAGAVATAAGVAALATMLATSVGNAPSALAAVTSAVVNTSAESYQFSLTTTMAGVGSSVVTGAVDLQHALGTEVLTMSRGTQWGQAEMRFIGGYVYTWVSPGLGGGSPGTPWEKTPIPPPRVNNNFPGQGLEGYSLERPVSPSQLLGLLQYTATVRVVGPASGPGWSGTEYALTAPLIGEGRIVTGTVDVDQQGRVRRLMTTTTPDSPSDFNRTPTTEVLTFGDFGAPVQVSPPPPSQVTYTTTPYWPFPI